MLPVRMLGSLALMILLCDAASACPSELNPLSLDPPEIIAEYGTSVVVNCTSAVEVHDGLLWVNHEAEEDESFVSLNVSLEDWNAEAQCKIVLNASRENDACSKDLRITIYKNPDKVDLYPINQGNASAESALQCDVSDAAPVRNLVVRWYKDNQLVNETSFTSTSKTPVSESARLTVRREENGARVRCEAQLVFAKGGPQLPAIRSTEHNVSVHYAPELRNETDVEVIYVEKGDNVTLSCEADGNPPPVLQWTRDGVNISENSNNLRISGVNASATYNCTAKNYLGHKTKQTYVNVMAPTMAGSPAAVATPMTTAPTVCPLTLSPAEIVVRFGDPASVNCSTSSPDFAGIGWESEVGGSSFQEVSSLTWTVERLRRWGIKPICFVTMKNNDQCTLSPVITLYKTPDFLSVVQRGPMVEGSESELVCRILNVAPVQNLTVVWYRGNETLHTETFKAPSVTPEQVTSVLRITPQRRDNGMQFVCKAELRLRAQGQEVTPSLSAAPYVFDVQYGPRVQACPDRYSSVEHNFTLSMVPCRADGNPPPAVYWYKQGTRVNESEPLNRTHSGEYTVEFVNRHGNSSASVLITAEYGPSFACDDRYDVEENGELQPACEPDGIPTPVITWRKDGREEASPRRWTKHDSGSYLLTANNKHGTVQHPLYINVLYAPEFKVRNSSMTVTPGANVTWMCFAEGNPAPALELSYASAENVRETTGWHHKNISITAATSTNAGVYACVATNQVGSVTSFVTLTMTDAISGVHIAVIALLVVLLLILVITLIIFFRRKKYGHYRLVGKSNDISLKPAGK